MRSWMSLGLITVLALGTVPSVRADEPSDLTKELARLNRNMDALKAQLDKIEGDLKAENLRGLDVSARVRELNERLTQLERQVVSVMNSQSTVRNYYDPRSYEPRSNYPAPSSTDVVPGPAVANRGVLHIENRYSVPVTVYINDRAYTVAPFQTQEVRGLPAGVFTYEVMAEGYGQIQGPVARTLAPGGSHNIVVYPRIAALP